MSAIIEAVKDGLRVVVAAVLPVVILGLDATTGSIAIDWNIVLVVAILAVLKTLDRWVHESPDIKANGIIPF